MTHTALHELDRLEAASSLVLAGYVLAGAPPALVEVYLRPGRTSDERRAPRAPDEWTAVWRGPGGLN